MASPKIPISAGARDCTLRYLQSSRRHVRLIQILTYVLKEKRVVVSPTLIPIAILLWYVRDGGFTKLDVIPGSGLDAGTKVCVGAAILRSRDEIVILSGIRSRSTTLRARIWECLNRTNSKYDTRTVECGLLVALVETQCLAVGQLR